MLEQYALSSVRVVQTVLLKNSPWNHPYPYCTSPKHYFILHLNFTSPVCFICHSSLFIKTFWLWFYSTVYTSIYTTIALLCLKEVVVPGYTIFLISIPIPSILCWYILTAIPIPIPNHMDMWPGSIWAFLPHLNVRLRHSYGKKFFHKICDSYFCTHEL